MSLVKNSDTFLSKEGFNLSIFLTTTSLAACLPLKNSDYELPLGIKILTNELKFILPLKTRLTLSTVSSPGKVASSEMKEAILLAVR